uniref:Uncharacterized protein n=1 Tax=Neolamprologus brichardi TaxID=32507 RepID=A0A3Q4MEU4_NEOBR
METIKSVLLAGMQRPDVSSAKTLWLFLLLNHLPLCPVGADEVLSTTQIYSQDYSQDQRSSPTLAVSTTLTTSEDKNSINGTRGDCLVDTEMGLIAISSAGGLIVCLLAATVVLACQVCSLQRQVYGPRTSRSNMDLVSSTGYWGTDQPEITGLVGPYDARKKKYNRVVTVFLFAEGSQQSENGNLVNKLIILLLHHYFCLFSSC